MSTLCRRSRMGFAAWDFDESAGMRLNLKGAS